MVRLFTTVLFFLALSISYGQEDIFKNRQHVRNSYVESVTRWTCCITNCDKKGHARKREQHFYDKDGRETRRDIYITHSDPDLSIFFYYDKKGTLVRKSDYNTEQKDTLHVTLYEYDDKGTLLREVTRYKQGDDVITIYEYDDKGLVTTKLIQDDQGNIDEKITYTYDKKEIIASDIYKEENGSLTHYEKLHYEYDGKWGFPVKVRAHLDDGTLLSENIHEYTFDGKLVEAIKTYNAVTGEKSTCTHYYHYTFYEQY